MCNRNLPWKYSHIKELIRYRNWESIKHIFDYNKKRQLIDAYNLDKKILFIHIPKTAGVSLIKTYEEYFADAKHNPVLLYKLLLGNKFRLFTTISIVRNPWARIFSAYNFLTEGGLSGVDPQMGQLLIEKCPTFERFIKEWLPQNGVCSYGHFVPQHEFVCGWSENIIVNHIVKLEQLDKGWPKLVEKLGIPLRNIHRVNASAKKEYRHYYDNESIDIVRKLYKKEIKLLHYTYE